MSSTMRRSSVPEAEPVDEEDAAVGQEIEAVPEEDADGSIELNADEIRKRAYALSQVKRSYDDFVWMWAEQEARLAKALVVPFGPNVRKVVVDASRITTKPKESDIRRVAAELAKHKAKVQDIHWFIAERQFAVEKALGS